MVKNCCLKGCNSESYANCGISFHRFQNMDFIIGGLAGAGASVFTTPMDVVKTRLQLQGELQSPTETKTKYRGTFHAMYVIVMKDGLKGLQKGLAPAVIIGFVVNSVRLGIYHIAEVQGWTKNKNGDISIDKAIFWSGLGGLLGGIICNPLLVIRTRLQSNAHPSIAVGRQHNYIGMRDGFVKILRSEGIKGYFAGISVTGPRLLIGSASQLTTFSKAKEMLLSHGVCNSSPFALAFAASAVSGIVIVLTGCPIDVAAVRLYNQGRAENGKLLYTGIVDCITKIYKTEGFHGLYKGVGPLYLKLAPHTTISLVIWDVLNNFLQRNKTS